jgi:4'-phosphopantetheinyl transferase
MPAWIEKNSRQLSAQAHAWTAWTRDVAAASLARCCAGWLTPDERQRLEQLLTPRLQHEYRLTRALCRIVLSHYADVDPADWKFTTGRFGKPRIAGPAGYTSLRFNLTHTNGLVICIVSRAGEVGIDAEETSRPVDVDEIIQHFFAPAEQTELAALPAAKRRERFFEHWVVKEAYLKGIGQGILRELERLGIEWDRTGRPADKGFWRFSLHRVGAHHIAAATVRCKNDVPIRWMSAARLLKARVAIEA